MSPGPEPAARHADVSAIVTTVNRPVELARCLNAILSGDVLPAELVVVDQGDGGAQAVLRQCAGRGVRLVYVRQPRNGLAAARNAALSAARSTFLAITDDDCCPHPQWIATAMAILSAPTAPDAVTGQVLPLGPDLPGTYAVSSRTSEAPRQFRRTIAPWNIGTGGNCALPRDRLTHVGGYDERLGAGSPGKAAEDMDLFYRLLRQGAVICYEPRMLVYHARQSLAARRASRFTYGFGIGAFCGLRLRARDLRAVAVLFRWAALRLKLVASALPRAGWQRVSEELTILRSTLPGLRYGLFTTLGRKSEFTTESTSVYHLGEGACERRADSAGSGASVHVDGRL